MLAAARLIGVVLFLLLAAGVGVMLYLAEKTVSASGLDPLEYGHIVDLVVYDEPLKVSKNDLASEVERHLRGSNFGECGAGAKAELAGLPPRTQCRRGGTLAVKSFSPFTDYTFEINRQTGRISEINTAGGAANEALLPSPILSAVNLDGKMKIGERVRYDLLLGKELDADSLAIKFFIRIEDRRFFEHGGNDWQGIGRAAFENLKGAFSGSDEQVFQGGSTITEQVAKLIYLPDADSMPGKLWRRAQALFLAESLERHLTKRQILELWLNLTVMGLERPGDGTAVRNYAQRQESVRGFKTAARVLFNKSLSQCTPAELATLAALPRNPRIMPSLKKDGALNVADDPSRDKLNERRKAALKDFATALEEGGRAADAERFRAAVKESVRFAFHEDDLKGDEALVTFLEQDLETFLAEHAAKLKGRGGMRQGLAVVLTTDREFQRAVSQSLEKELLGIKKKLVQLTGSAAKPQGGSGARGFQFEVQVDVVALAAEGGELRALSSLKTKGERVSPNRANVNPPSFIASCAKPLIVAHAFGEGVITPHTLIRASDCAAPSGLRFEGPPDARALPLSDHLIHSRNAPMICLGNLLGIDNVLDKWREIFPRAKSPGPGFAPDPYQVLRGLNRPEAEVTPTDVAQAYSALARRGQQLPLRVVESVYAGVERLPEVERSGRQVFKPEAAVLTATLLRAGTRGLANWKQTAGYDLALKTGSASNAYWVVMFSPKIVVVVRYLIVPAEKLADAKAAHEFEREAERRFETVFAGNVVKPLADSLLLVIKQKRLGWLRGTFSHENVVNLLIDPERECATSDGSGIRAEYIRGTEPKPCPAEEGGGEAAGGGEEREAPKQAP